MKRLTLAATLIAGLFAIVSCTRPPIERAVKRDLLPSEANVVVANHCQGCHIHAKFDPEVHMELIKLKFPAGDPLKEAGECLECHVLKLENFFRKEFRSTKRPHGQLVQMTDIPKPELEIAKKRSRGASVPEKPEPEKTKKKKWYFFYLF